MNEKFLELPKEKQLRIINSCMDVFSKYDYKHASTDEMAAKAGISKGLLFYYFHNKKSLYLFLFQYAEAHLKEEVVDEEFLNITDFFELMMYSGEKKVKVLAETPYMTEFALNAFYSQQEEISEAMNHRIGEAMNGAMMEYFKKIDFSKFKNTISPEEIMQMLTYLGDGYFHEKRRRQESVDMQEILALYRRWCDMLKEISYKEEFLHGNHSC